MFNKNKRKFPRLNVHHLIKYKMLEAEETVTFARNLSAGGLRFYSKEELPRESTIELSINFPDTEEPLKILARIVWVRKLTAPGGFEVGAQFLNLDEDTCKLINEKIRNTFKIAREGDG